MNEDKVIFEDLKKYLKKRGMKAKVEFEFGKWCIVLKVSVFDFCYLIIDGKICDTAVAFGQTIPVGKSIVSLADPEYREKFYECLRSET